MFKSMLTIACAVVALALTTGVNAQDCSTCDSGSKEVVSALGLNDCGRQFTNEQAASLWAGYCTENCALKKRCKLFSGCNKTCGTGNKFGYPGGGCGQGCGQGCFGNGGCGIVDSCGGGCNLFSKFKNHSCGLFSKLGGGCGLGDGCGLGGGCDLGCGCGLGLGLGHGSCGLGGVFHRGDSCGCGHSCKLGSMNLFSKLKNDCGGCGQKLLDKFAGVGCGCGLMSKLKSCHSKCGGLFSRPVRTSAIDQCGCGNSCEYFNYAVGAEYGNCGMQSDVSGVLSGEGGASVIDAEKIAPAYGSTDASAISEKATDAAKAASE